RESWRLFHSTSGCAEAVSLGLTQSSMVKPAPVPTFRLAEEAMSTSSSMPSKVSDWPTSPEANAAPPRTVPVLVPTISEAFPSSCHHATTPAGGATQAAEDHEHTLINASATRGRRVKARREEVVFINC